LKDDDALAPEVEFIRIILESVALLHPLANIKAAIHGRNLADGDMTTKGDILLGLFHRDILFKKG